MTGSRQGCWHNWSPNFTSASAEEMRTPQVYCPPILLQIPEERKGERERWKKKTEQNKNTQKSHVWARWQAGSRRKCWIGRAVRCVWEWEGWGLPTQRPAAQQHRNPAETGQGEADDPLTQRVKAGRRGGGDQMRLGGGTSSFCWWNGWVSWGWRLLERESALTGLRANKEDWKGNGGRRKEGKD